VATGSAIGGGLYPEAVRVLVAPDKFKGTLTAQEAAEAIAAGWARGAPDDTVDVVPMADGGEGTLDALVAALEGERHRLRVTGPLGDPVEAQFGIVHSDDRLTGVVEMARASGLALISAGRRDPKRATTRGTGELIREACRRGAEHVLVCIGGSATNDAGAGMAQALGARLLDESGRELSLGGAALVHLARIDLGGLDRAAGRARFTAATDVDNPLVGPNGASAVYGPQKGATPEDVKLLDLALGHFAAVVYRDLGIDLRDVPGAGAAGGLGAGLMVFLGARLRPGVEVVMEAVGLRERLRRADLVVTGEGTFDRQSLHGKAPAGVLRAASEMRLPVVVLCGRAETAAPEGRVISLVKRVGEEMALGRPREALARVASQVAAELHDEKAGRKSGWFPQEGRPPRERRN
jgi:glycerate 2-kinase